jgi:hypothetical protein
VLTGTFLGVIPNWPDYFGIRRDAGTGGGVYVHVIRVMFVELVKLSSDPFVAVRAFQTCAPSVIGPSSHVGRIGCGDKKDGLFEIPSAQNVMYYPELVDRDLRGGDACDLLSGW